MTKEAKALKESYQWQAKAQVKTAPLSGPLSVTLTIYHGDRRVRDIDNYNKLVFDALTGIAYEDDGQIDELRLVRRYDKARPRLEVELSTGEELD